MVRVAASELVGIQSLPLFAYLCVTALLKRERGWHKVVRFSAFGVVLLCSSAG